MKWLDSVETKWWVFLAVFLLVAPIFPEPHLVEKAKMILAGTLSEPLDIFDIFWHLTGVVILGLKLHRGEPPKEEGES